MRMSKQQIPCLICFEDFPGYDIPTQTLVANYLSDHFQVFKKYMNLESNYEFDFRQVPFPFCVNCKQFVLNMTELDRKLVKMEQRIRQIGVNASAKILSTLEKHSEPQDMDKLEDIPLLNRLYVQWVLNLREQIRDRYTIEVHISNDAGIKGASVTNVGGKRASEISSNEDQVSYRRRSTRRSMATPKRIEEEELAKSKSRGRKNTQGASSASETESTSDTTKTPRGRPRGSKIGDEVGSSIQPVNSGEISKINAEETEMVLRSSASSSGTIKRTFTVAKQSQKQNQASAVSSPKRWEETVFRNLLISKRLMEMLRQPNPPEIVIDEVTPDGSCSGSGSDMESDEKLQELNEDFDSDESVEVMQPMFKSTIFNEDYDDLDDVTTASDSDMESVDDPKYRSKVLPSEGKNQVITEFMLEDFPSNFNENSHQSENSEFRESEDAISVCELVSDLISAEIDGSTDTDPLAIDVNFEEIKSPEPRPEEHRNPQSEITESGNDEAIICGDSECETIFSREKMKSINTEPSADFALSQPMFTVSTINQTNYNGDDEIEHQVSLEGSRNQVVSNCVDITSECDVYTLSDDDFCDLIKTGNNNSKPPKDQSVAEFHIHSRNGISNLINAEGKPNKSLATQNRQGQTAALQIVSQDEIESQQKVCGLTIRKKPIMRVRFGRQSCKLKRIQCDRCSSRFFVSKQSLENHQRKYCGKPKARSKKPYVHTIYNSGQNKNKIGPSKWKVRSRLSCNSDPFNIFGGSYICEVCGLFYNRRKLFQEHIRKDHVGMEQYFCRFCPTKFSRIRALIRHQRTHKDQGQKSSGSNFCIEKLISTRNSPERRGTIGDAVEKEHLDKGEAIQVDFNHEQVFLGHLHQQQLPKGTTEVRRPCFNFSVSPSHLDIVESLENIRASQSNYASRLNFDTLSMDSESASLRNDYYSGTNCPILLQLEPESSADLLNEETDAFMTSLVENYYI